MEKPLTKHQANALIQRADIAVNEAGAALESATRTARMAAEAHQQAVEMRAMVRNIVGNLMEKENV